MVRGGRPREKLAEADQTPSKRRLPINIRSCASAVTPSEKVQLTRIGGLLQAFQ